MKSVVVAAFFVLLPGAALAKEQMRKFRWISGLDGKPQIFLGTAMLRDEASQSSKPILLPAVGEFVAKESQTLGKAKVQGTWKQTIFKPSGEVVYAAGAVMDQLPSASALESMERELAKALREVQNTHPELIRAQQIFPPSLEVKKNEKGEWEPFWRVEYLSESGDRLRYILFSKSGETLGTGEQDWDGADGRALVFPDGPRLSSAQEETLKDLIGDGTITGRLLHVFSALDLKVWSPGLTFFFSQDDRRFDLGQAYYSISKGFDWLKSRLGVELNHKIDVRLHVGTNGVSNAAFYHGDTIYLGTGDGVSYKDMVRDPSILIHEGIHAIIDQYVGLPPDGQGGSFNEGFADLFTALILDNPRMGEASYLKGPYRRSLENNLIAYRDFSSGVYQNGTIVGATFWDMKGTLGTELTAKLAFRTLVRLGKGVQFDDFPDALANACDGLLSAEQKAFALGVARNRGWKVP